MKGLTKILAVSLPLIFSSCSKSTYDGASVARKHTAELDSAEAKYGALGFDRHEAFPLYSTFRDSNDNAIPIDSRFVKRCVDLYKKYNMEPNSNEISNEIVLFKEQGFDFGQIESFIVSKYRGI